MTDPRLSAAVDVRRIAPTPTGSDVEDAAWLGPHLASFHDAHAPAGDNALPAWAATSAARLLQPLPDRWRHTVAVARQAERVAGVLPVELRPLLLAAAFLHDVGYAPELVLTGFHPLDGASALATCAPTRLTALVAHHTGARYEAARRGLSDQLARYQREVSLLADALAYSDLTTGPRGESLTVAARWAEIEHRYGSDHAAPRSLQAAKPALVAAVGRVGAALDAHDGAP